MLETDRPKRPAGEGSPMATDVLDGLADLIRAYLRDNRRAETPVVEHHDPDTLGRLFDVSLGPDGVDEQGLLTLVEGYLRYSVRTAHPQFSNQLFAGFSLAGFLGEVTASLTNTTMCTFEAAPLATLMERELVQRMAARVGYRTGDGIFGTGGSHANLLAVLTARQRAFPDVKRKGLREGLRPTVFVSDQAHYSWTKAAGVLGIGVEQLISVPSDAQGRMLPDGLDRAVRMSRQRGDAPFLVGATAGTTVQGAFDPLREIAAIAEQHDLWFHVDGAWGGSVLLSERHRHLLDGSELSDSFSWDAHKMLGAPLPCSVFLTRHAHELEDSCGLDDDSTEYILHDNDEAALDSGRSSLQCGRRVDALKLWLMWKSAGDRGLEQRVDRLFALAAHAARRVESEPRLELAAPVQSCNVCFRYRPPAGEDSDKFQLELRERLRRSGEVVVNYAPVGGSLALRLVCANPDVTESDLDRFFEHVLTAAATTAEACAG